MEVHHPGDFADPAGRAGQFLSLFPRPVPGRDDRVPGMVQKRVVLRVYHRRDPAKPKGAFPAVECFRRAPRRRQLYLLHLPGRKGSGSAGIVSRGRQGGRLFRLHAGTFSAACEDPVRKPAVPLHFVRHAARDPVVGAVAAGTEAVQRHHLVHQGPGPGMSRSEIHTGVFE